MMLKIAFSLAAIPRDRKSISVYTVLLVLALCELQASLSAQLIPSADRLTVYDDHLQVRWLANANLAGTSEGVSIASAAGITTITPGGSMDYNTALQWVNALNGMNVSGASGYLGHTTWTLPTSPVDDGTAPLDFGCTSHGPEGDRFGFGCTFSDMGGLFNLKTSLGLQWPNTAVPIPDTQVGPFHNFQPYLYWSAAQQHTFSFNTGWAGSNTNNHYMYVLPMVKSRVLTEYNNLPVQYVSAGVGTLEVSTDGQLVYDPAPIDVTFLADADLAKSQTFGAQCASYVSPDNATVFPPGIPCISPDGSMAQDTANNSWINGMNAYMGVGWLGQQNWRLPPDPGGCGNFGCTDSPMGDLYNIQLRRPQELRRPQGTPVVPTPDIDVGPFNHVQPYLYWSCGAPVTNPPCQTPTPPVSTQEWSFSFGNGFQGTDLQVNDLYVMIYFPQTPAQALVEAIGKALGENSQLNAFLTQAAGIISAPNADAKAGELTAFINYVNAQRGKALNAAQADELIALAQIN